MANRSSVLDVAFDHEAEPQTQLSYVMIVVPAENSETRLDPNAVRK